MISDTCHAKNEIATSACGLLAMTLFFEAFIAKERSDYGNLKWVKRPIRK